jgi:hypothetical protein
LSSFDDIPFKVLGEGGSYPLPERDAEGVRRWIGGVLFATTADRDALAATLSIVTPLTVYGRAEANLHLEGGYGAAALIVPSAAGVPTTYTALLVGMTAVRADGRQSAPHRADLEFVLP